MLGIGTGVHAGSSYVLTDLKEATGNTAVSLQLWLQNDTAITAAKWTDQSGNNNHATQSSEANQATVSGGGLDFEEDQDDHYDLSNTIAIGAQGGFCLAVVLQLESNGNNTILSKDSSDQFRVTDGTTFRFKSNVGGNITTDFVFPAATFATGEKMLILLNRSAGSSNKFTFEKNGTTLTADVDLSSNEASGENPNGFDINILGGHTGASQFFDGEIYELAFWNRSLTATEIADVNSYLQEIHGL